MDQIDKDNVIIGKLIEIYNDKTFQKNLDLAAQNIVDKFRMLIENHGSDFDLFSKNSVRDIKYFNIIYRIKEDKSLKEKFYRNNLLNKDFSFIKNLTDSQIESEKDRIRTTFKGLGDIIGIKILTDLNTDCRKIYSLLRNYESKFISENINLDKNDLKSQPTVMDNGLDIYKINATFTPYVFELQIKSKLLSVWGDMEHSIFYKDYFISPVRENTQATMNHIGKLLFQIDDFLESVRESNKSFHKKSDVISFLTWFDLNYSLKISKKLSNMGFKIDNFSEILYFIKNNNKFDDNISKRDLHFKHFRFATSDRLFGSYIQMREANFELKIFESIVFSWLWKPSEVTAKTVDSKFTVFFENIYNFLVAGIIADYKGDSRSKIKKKIIYYIENLLFLESSPSMFFSIKKYLKHISFIDFIKSELELEGISNLEKQIEKFDLFFLILRMNGNIRLKIEKDNISDFNKISLKESLKLIIDNIRKKDKVSHVEDIEYIDILIKHLSA